jgi:hypothetical protein
MAALLGSQTPRFNIAPAPVGFTTFDADDAVEYAAFYGLEADEWQRTTCESWMRKRKGRWCASTWGITVSRQNGKNGSLEIVELYGIAELGLKFLHTAHEVKTARKAFSRLKYFFGERAGDPGAKFPELNALVREVRNTNGQEAIILHNGGSVEFIARSKGSGRGFTVDVLVLDEAQDLQDSELEALLPTISAAPSGDPVTIFMGTPPADIGDKGEPFIRARDGAIDGSDKRIAWVEFSAVGNIETMKPEERARFLDDRKNWALANPALGGRINIETIITERARFSDFSFARERLNMWPEFSSRSDAIPSAVWNKLAITVVPEEWPLAAVGLDMNPERTRVSIAVAAFAPEHVHVELADGPDDKSSSTALVDWVVERVGRRVPVVIDAYSPARSLEPELKKRRCLVRIMGAAELSQACGGLYDAVTQDGSVSHFGQSQLDQSLAGATKENFGHAGAWKWNRRSFDIDLSPLMAATAAHFGAVKFGNKPRAEDAKKRRTVIL